MRIGSLFAGIGGLELGLERAGVGETVWQVEIDPFCRRVLEKHWPNAQRFNDVRSVGAATLPAVDVICGGFPCTDLSLAARGVARSGLDGERSGLWYEMLRVISELRPQAIVTENVAGPWRNWLPHMRRDLHGIGYASVSFRLRAADVGAPHGRARIFVVSYPHGDAERYRSIHAEASRVTQDICARGDWSAGAPSAVGMDDGGAERVDRNGALGNAVLPQCTEVIGRALKAAIGAENPEAFQVVVK